MTDLKMTKDAISKRIEAYKEFLKKDHPEIFTEQKHLDAGTSERAYWHYGYMVALRDIQTQAEDAACQTKQ